MKNRETKDSDFVWVYTGGYFQKDKRFAGDIELSFIGIWPDRSAVINLCSNMKNPYQGNYGFELNIENKEFAIDHKFELIIKRYK
ncbi:hypothetical protein MHK_001174 [Candidatus Magnetomorum sp. HK-1]|nr:hypothetical protein MHK_001174 [Candidatus Magnetomorum sp. HK-1]